MSEMVLAEDYERARRRWLHSVAACSLCAVVALAVIAVGAWYAAPLALSGAAPSLAAAVEARRVIRRWRDQERERRAFAAAEAELAKGRS